MKAPRAEITMSTKKLVDALLEMNTENRVVKRSVVEKYKRDIINKKWMLTNQGIGVSDEGVLIDGQHRLIALKECGYPQLQILIVYGLSKESQKVVDQQAKRSARDLLMFAFNARVVRNAPAIGNCIIRSKNGWGGIGSPTISELMETLNDYMDEIQLITDVPKEAYFYAAPFMAAFVMAAKKGDSEKVVEFMKIVENGEMLTKDMPAFHLRNMIITTRKGSSGSGMQAERFRKCQKAIQAFINNEKMGVLR